MSYNDRLNSELFSLLRQVIYLSSLDDKSEVRDMLLNWFSSKGKVVNGPCPAQDAQFLAQFDTTLNGIDHNKPSSNKGVNGHRPRRIPAFGSTSGSGACGGSSSDERGVPTISTLQKECNNNDIGVEVEEGSYFPIPEPISFYPLPPRTKSPQEVDVDDDEYIPNGFVDNLGPVIKPWLPPPPPPLSPRPYHTSMKSGRSSRPKIEMEKSSRYQKSTKNSQYGFKDRVDSIIAPVTAAKFKIPCPLKNVSSPHKSILIQIQRMRSTTNDPIAQIKVTKYALIDFILGANPTARVLNLQN